MKKALTVYISIFLSAGCGANHFTVQNAYVASQSGGCYEVRLGFPMVSDETISQCLSLDEAKATADAINRDMQGKWIKP